jgi:hypothetical protein
MGKHFRTFIAIIVMLSLAILAKSNITWAANLGAGSSPTSLGQAQQSGSLDKDKQCDKDKDKKKKDKDKDKCKDKDDDGGSVKPPPGIIIPVTGGGTYSVGGICTITIEYKVPGLSDVVSLEVPVEKSSSVPFPESNGKIHLPGCRVLHYQFEEVQTEMSTEEGSWTICFAARPKKTMTIYYYLDDLETVIPTWVPRNNR